jgi:NAD(P)-dependent dehydrogenase (short-subunit alcohol dehydrogenase family)
MPAEKYPTEMWTRLLDINLTGTFLMSRAIGQHMIAAGKPGSMVFIASMSGGIVNFPQEQSCYNASKAGVIQYGKSLATEWAKHNIRVNMISPGKLSISHQPEMQVLIEIRLHGYRTQQRPQARRPESHLEATHPTTPSRRRRRPQRSRSLACI